METVKLVFSEFWNTAEVFYPIMGLFLFILIADLVEDFRSSL